MHFVIKFNPWIYVYTVGSIADTDEQRVTSNTGSVVFNQVRLVMPTISHLLSIIPVR